MYLLSMLFVGREETADSTGLESRNRSGDEDTSMGVAATKLVKAIEKVEYNADDPLTMAAKAYI